MTSNRTMRQLQQLKQNNSDQYGANPGGQECTPLLLRTAPIKSKGLLNWDRLFKQKRREGEVETELHASQLKQQRELDEFRDVAAIEAAKHAIQCSRIAADDRSEKRAQHHLRVSGAQECVYSVDAVEYCTMYIDNKLSRAEEIVQDGDLKKALKAELKDIHNRATTIIKGLAFGLKLDPGSYDHEEYL